MLDDAYVSQETLTDKCFLNANTVDMVLSLSLCPPGMQFLEECLALVIQAVISGTV